MRTPLFLLVHDFSSTGETGMAAQKPAQESEVS